MTCRHKIAGKIYEYDDAGNMIREVNQDGSEMFLEYNNVGRIIRMVKCYDGCEWIWEYDEAGNMIRQVHPDGYEWRREYDTIESLIEEVKSDGSEKYQVKIEDIINDKYGFKDDYKFGLFRPMLDGTNYNYSSIVSIEEILELCGLEAALVALQNLPQSHREAVRILVIKLVEPVCIDAKDSRPMEALLVAEAYSRGKASKEEFENAHNLLQSAIEENRGWKTQRDYAVFAGFSNASYAFKHDPEKHASSAAYYSSCRLSIGKFDEFIKFYQEKILRSWLGQNNGNY